MLPYLLPAMVQQFNTTQQNHARAARHSPVSSSATALGQALRQALIAELKEMTSGSTLLWVPRSELRLRTSVYGFVYDGVWANRDIRFKSGLEFLKYVVRRPETHRQHELSKAVYRIAAEMPNKEHPSVSDPSTQHTRRCFYLEA